MQVAPKAIGNFPNIPDYPHKKVSNPSRRPLPQSNTRTAGTNALCKFMLAVAILITPFALINLTVKVFAAENGYRIIALNKSIDAQNKKSENINLTNAKLSSLERIKTVAISKLAMTEPSVEATIISMPGEGVTSPEYASLTTKEVR